MSGQTQTPSGAQWFALHTLSNKEGRVKQYIERYKTIEELDDYIFEVLLPTEVVSEVKQGKKKSQERKLMPGYVFIHMKLYDENGKVLNRPWYFVRETTGVISFVGGKEPSPLRESEIADIRARMEAASGKETPKIQYEISEEVKITDGPFLNLNGRIDEIDPDKGKLKVSVSIFGRFTPVELEYWQVERITD
jgi:transcriptional antiterminator NusG